MHKTTEGFREPFQRQRRALHLKVQPFLLSRPKRAGKLIEHHFEGRSVSFLQLVGRRLSRQAGGRLAFLTANPTPGSPEGFFLLAAGPDFGGNLPELGKIAGEILEGRGGGSGSLFQGKARDVNQRTLAARALRKELE